MTHIILCLVDYSRKYLSNTLIGCYGDIYNWSIKAPVKKSEVLMTNELCSIHCFDNYQQISATKNG